MTDNLKSGREDQLIGISKKYHKAIGDRDAKTLGSLFADKIVLYGDKMTIQDNINGNKNVVSYFQAFFDRYDFERQESFGAVDQNDSVAFSIVTDKKVAPKEGNRKQPSNVISLTMLEINDKDLITGIYIARQMPYDEAERKLKYIPDYNGSSFNAENLSNDGVKPSAEKAKLHENYADIWNQMFADGDVSKAEEICDPDVKVHALLFSSETKGLQAWKDNLKGIFDNWTCKGNEHITAVTPGNKGFVFWRTTGVYKEDWCTVWGINYISYNKDDKIQEVASIYQPFPGMRQSLFKDS